MIDQGNEWSDTGHMARKGKADKTPKIDPAVRAQVDMSFDERRKRLIGLGMTPEEVDAHFAVTGKLGLEKEEAEMLAQVEQLTKTELCTAHVPNEEHPEQCAKCGAPLAIPGRAEWADGLAAVKEFEAAHGALTPAELEAAELRIVEREARQSEKRFEKASEHPLIKPLIDQALGKAADDGPSYEPLEELWRMRLSILAQEAGQSPRDYVQMLVRRQWVARGKGKA